MKKITKKNLTTTKTKAVSKGTLSELANIQKAKKGEMETNKIAVTKKNNNIIPFKNINKIEKSETTKTKSSKILMKKGGTIIETNEKENKNDEYVMIEKSITVRQTKTTFLDDDEEDEMFNEDWFGGSKLKKQKQIEEGMEEEDLDTIIESFGSDVDKYW